MDALTHNNAVLVYVEQNCFGWIVSLPVLLFRVRRVVTMTSDRQASDQATKRPSERHTHQKGVLA